MRDLTLAGLQVVREIALSGSFTAAAQTLGYSQPAISRQVAAMEAAVGRPLFVREPRGVRPTPAGALVVQRAARLLAGLDGLAEDLAGLDDRLAGRVRLGAFPAATAVLVPRAVARLRVEHPGLEVALAEASTPALLRRLRAGRIGVAVIGVGAGLPDYDLADLRPTPLFDGDLCVAVPAGHRIAGAGRVEVGELAGEAWIVGDGPAGDTQFAAWPTLPDPDVRYSARGWPSRLGLVAAGLGVCVLPELAAASVPAGVAVVRVDDAGWAGRVTTAVTAPGTGADPDAVAAVVDALRAAAATLDRPGS